MKPIQIGGRTFALPKSRLARIIIGVVLIIGGILGFLPVLGFWMIPLGILVLSYELHLVRRLRRRFDVWFARKKNGTQPARHRQGPDNRPAP